VRREKLDEKISEKLLQNYDKLYRLAYSYARNEQDAMDIVQESAYKAIKYSNQVREEQYIETWIYKITINTAITYINKAKKESIGMEEYQLEYEEQYMDFDVMDSLKKLEEEDRTVLILRYFEDRKLSEIAKITGENVNTVKSRLYRALKKLKIELEPENREVIV
jgi:RNA polymerase sigma-70 factor (ECF subfamily)